MQRSMKLSGNVPEKIQLRHSPTGSCNSLIEKGLVYGSNELSRIFSKHCTHITNYATTQFWNKENGEGVLVTIWLEM